jgi:eukaryotic-like serine/threonine-protein kinase
MGKTGDTLGPTAVSPIASDSRSADTVVPATLPAAPAAPALPPGTVVGRYVIEGPLGEGGMGVVYLAHDPQLERRVALKLLRPDASQAGEDSSGGRSRLVREAHAMAKLNHPNVVVIYDSGIFGDQVFLAVEVVEGTDMKKWLAAPHGWREILEVFLKAGRGLAAAHAAGLVHRDFKPENVLIGRRGEVKVTDFGLARAAVQDRLGAAVELLTAAAPAEIVSDQVLVTPLTRDGAVSGTPGYMAPEQMLGRGGDARTDEFSFCVALYRALYGELPFKGRLDPLGPNEIKPPTKGSHVPTWVRRALLRGLSIKPEARYDTLPELLDSLADDPAVSRRRVLVAGGVVLLLLAAVGGTALFVQRQRAAADPCHDPEGKLAGIWDDVVRSRVRAAFAATGTPDAASTAAYAEKAMDRATGAWLAAYHDACQATRERHVQSEAALNLRLDCLDEERFDLRAAEDLMSHPDPKKLTAAIGAAGKLPLPSECADARALSVVEQPTAERRPQIEALRLRLARGRALQGVGRQADAIEVLKSLPDEAEALDAKRLEAEAILDLARSYNAAGGLEGYQKAGALAERGVRLAEAAHLDQLAPLAAVQVALDDALLGRPASDVDAALERARSAVRRVGPGGPAEYHLERVEASVDNLRGRDAASAVHARRALEMSDRLFGRDSDESVRAANNLASELEPLAAYDEEIELYKRAIASSDSLLGPGNLRALIPLGNLSELLFDLGRTDECEQTLDGLFARLGPEDRREVAFSLAVRGALQAAQGKHAESLQTVGRALDMGTRLHMPGTPGSTDLFRYSTEAYLRDGRPQLAAAAYDQYLARPSFEGDSDSQVAFLRLGGWAHLDAGQPKQALPILERALKLSATHPFYPGWVPRLRYQIARALVETHGDRLRAEKLAQAAHDDLKDVAVMGPLLAEIDAWRAKAFGPR